MLILDGARFHSNWWLILNVELSQLKSSAAKAGWAGHLVPFTRGPTFNPFAVWKPRCLTVQQISSPVWGCYPMCAVYDPRVAQTLADTLESSFPSQAVPCAVNGTILPEMRAEPSAGYGTLPSPWLSAARRPVNGFPRQANTNDSRFRGEV